MSVGANSPLAVELLRFSDNARRITNAVINFNKLGKASQTKQVTQGRVTLLEKHWEAAQGAAETIELQASKEERATLVFFKESQLEQLEELYLAAYDFFQERLGAFQSRNVAGGGTAPAEASGNAVNDFKLPTIQVPPFSGILTDWIAFRDLFTSLVTDRASLTNVQRLHYLLSVVTGDAAKLIAHISLSNDNFPIAWNVLKEQYENERVIIDAQFLKFFAIKAVGYDVVNGLKMLRASSFESLNALRALRRPVDDWNDILVFCIVQKLDKNSRREWEVHLGEDRTYPKMDQLNKFLVTRIRSLETAGTVSISEKGLESSGKLSFKTSAKVVRTHLGTTTDSCSYCSKSHRIMQCEPFKTLSIPDRQKFARQKHLCMNCLVRGHSSADCRSTFACFHCNRRHHSLLHEQRGDRSRQGTQSFPGTNPAVTINIPTPESKSSASESIDSTVTHCHIGTRPHVSSRAILLATAWVNIESDQGRRVQARALIDPGSDASFISENMAQCLRLPRENTIAYVASIGGRTVNTIKNMAVLTVSASQLPTNKKLRFKALVIPKITAYLPFKPTSCSTDWMKGLPLADPEPNRSAPIELLLGADLYAEVILEGVRKGNPPTLILQNSIFGWILSGSYSASKSPPQRIHVHHASSREVTLDLHKFFEVEELPTRKILTPAKIQCEKHFKETHYRNPDGRYVVRLPFTKTPPIAIGDTEARARASFAHLEKRLRRDPELHQHYSAFLLDYQQANHMEHYKGSQSSAQIVYLPHHPVVKDSVTTKVRVVFNASAPSTNGSSLNDHLLPGPNLQTDLISVILYWRMFKYVFTADIAQMFRQILVDPRDRQFQMLLWRPSSQSAVQSYSLNTVTYGTACAPFLAQRVVLQVAEDEGPAFPLAVPILKRQRYMDDLMFGDDSKEGAIQNREQVTKCLAQGGFLLRKWASNELTLLEGINSANHGLAFESPLEEGSRIKVLGLNWSPIKDSFQITTHLPSGISPTKRQILSLIARCFDPLGWLAPVVIAPKILVQELWRLQLGWDEPVPESLATKWQAFCEQLPSLHQISIPRWTGSYKASSLHIHGFCDASERAYAAVTYLLVRSADGETQVSLMFAKTKVAPLKTLTMPRLELCAAVLLVRCITTLFESSLVDKSLEILARSDILSHQIYRDRRKSNNSCPPANTRSSTRGV